MKLKLLTVPLLVIAIIVFALWVLMPGYYTVKGEVKRMNEANGKLEDIKTKLQVADKLSQELSTRSEEQKIITKYLPENKEEENVINYLNDLALREGIVVTNLSMVTPKEEPAFAEVDPKTGLPSKADTTPVVKYAEVNVEAVGNYEKIKDFLKKLEGLDRYCKVSSMKISKNSVERENLASDSLSVKATLDFGYLKKIKTVSDISGAALAATSFDMSAVDYIKNNKNTEITELNLDASGKNNPFIP